MSAINKRSASEAELSEQQDSPKIVDEPESGALVVYGSADTSLAEPEPAKPSKVTHTTEVEEDLSDDEDLDLAMPLPSSALYMKDLKKHIKERLIALYNKQPVNDVTHPDVASYLWSKCTESHIDWLGFLDLEG